MSTRVAIQGGQASFHDMAARQYFADCPIELSECRTFRRLCIELAENLVDYALMAVENSLSGSILPNYALLQEFPFRITGETYLRIRQNLMALPSQGLSDIKNIRSHPVALQQCSDFLEKHPQIRCIESFDTAESAREISEKNLKGVAAIASTRAAQMYGLEILAESIEDVKQNYTRFVVLTADQGHCDYFADKASISFHVRHEVGALAKVLSIFRDNSINLGLIQSTPIPGKPYEYSFHVDVEWQDRNHFAHAVQQVRETATQLRILGEYKSGVKPYSSHRGSNEVEPGDELEP